MSSSKKTNYICLVAIMAALIITILFINGDKLGLTAVVDEDAEISEVNQYFTENDLDGNWDSENAVQITLEDDSASIKGGGAYFDDGNLTIKNGGWYVISGELTDGSIIVDTYESSKVWIMLNGVSVSCSDDAALIVTTADKVFLTLAEDTDNLFADGSSYSDDALDAGHNAAIYSKEDLTVNGDGSLTVTGNYEHGIKCNDSLVVTGGTVKVSAVQDGLHANDSIRLANAAITVNAGDDAIHCDKEVYYQDGTLLVESGYEGIESPQVEIAGGDITIHCSDDGINANGESENDLDDENQEESEEPMPLVHIKGGSITIINENGHDADGIDSNGDIIIDGGSVFVYMAGPGNSALDYATENGSSLYINGGTVITVSGGSMLEAVSDDSKQCNATVITASEVPAGSMISLKSSDDTTLLEQEIPCSFSCCTVSSPDLKQGETYCLIMGDQSQEIAFDTTTVASGSTSSAPQMNESMPDERKMAEGGQMPGNGQAPEGGQMPGNGQMPSDGQAPENRQMPDDTQNNEQQEDIETLSAYGSETWILLGASAVILIAGLLFAILYRRR